MTTLYILMIVRGRALACGIYAVCLNLLRFDGPVCKAFGALHRAFPAVSSHQMTVWVEEDAYGHDRVEWSVNQ